MPRAFWEELISRKEQTKRSEAWPPNLTLNLLYKSEKRWPIQLGAALGVVLQAGVLVVQGLITYRFQWKNGDEEIRARAFPLTCSGTVMLCAGMLACAHALQTCTSEEQWLLNQERGPKQSNNYMLWLQKGNQEVSHQRFDAFALYDGGSKNESRVWRSYKNYHHHYRLQLLVFLGINLSLVGWIAQFMGLSELHWSGVLVQLGATLIMTVARSVVRHRLSKCPKPSSLKADFEMDEIVMKTAKLTGWSICHHSLFEADDESKARCCRQNPNICSSRTISSRG